MAFPDIKIGSAFDGKGFKLAETATEKLGRKVSGLAKTFIGFYGATKLAAFGKSSLKAFLADEKAAASLGQTLKNTGNAFANIDVERFIKSLQRQTGVLDDDLRPAFQSLIVATGSVTAAQKGLNTALDVAVGTGSDVKSVTKAIAKAYAGNTASLAKMVPGIDKAVLASKDLNAINEELARLFGGQAATAAGTYAGQMKILAASAADAQETIGGGLMRAIAELGGGGGMGKASQGITDFAGVAAIELQGLAIGINKIFKSISENPIFKLIDKKLGLAKAIAQDVAISRQMNIAAPPVLEFGARREDKIAKDKAIADKKALDLTKKSNALTKKGAADALALKKQGSTFDLAQIQIQAALKYGIDEETRLRLLLQKALLEEDSKEAARLNGLLKENEAKTKELANLLATLPKADDPFADWPGIIANINRLMKDLKIPGGATAALATQGLTVNAAGTGVVDTGAAAAAAAAKSAADAKKIAEDIAKIWADANAKAEAERVRQAAANDAAAAAAEADAAAAAVVEADKVALETQAALDAFAAAQAAIDAAAQAIFDASFFGAPNMTTGGERGYAQGGGDNFYVTVNAGVVGSEQVIANEVQKVLQNLNRFGSSTNYAGSIDQ